MGDERCMTCERMIGARTMGRSQDAESREWVLTTADWQVRWLSRTGLGRGGKNAEDE